MWVTVPYSYSAALDPHQITLALVQNTRHYKKCLSLLLNGSWENATVLLVQVLLLCLFYIIDFGWYGDTETEKERNMSGFFFLVEGIRAVLLPLHTSACHKLYIYQKATEYWWNLLLLIPKYTKNKNNLVVHWGSCCYVNSYLNLENKLMSTVKIKQHLYSFAVLLIALMNFQESKQSIIIKHVPQNDHVHCGYHINKWKSCWWNLH